MSNSICPSCQKGCLSPIIRATPFLIIKEVCTQNEIEADTVFALAGRDNFGRPENTTSYYLFKELAMVGLGMNSFSLTNLYMHIPPKGRKTKEDRLLQDACTNFSISELIKVAQDKKIILMMGADTVRIFTGYSVTDVSGLLVKSDYLPNVPIIIPAPNCNKLMNLPIGELRCSLKVLAEQIEIFKQYKEI